MDVKAVDPCLSEQANDDRATMPVDYTSSSLLYFSPA